MSADATQTVEIGDVANPVSLRAGRACDFPVYAVTKHEGMVPSAEYFKKQVYSRDIEGYKVVRHGQFGYATIHLDEGAIGILESSENAIISPMYTVFETDDRKVFAPYLLKLLKSDWALAKYKTMGNGSVHRRRSIPFNVLAKMRIQLPTLDEQRRIAVVLDKADDLCARRDLAARLAERFLRATFLRMFGDPVTNPKGWSIRKFGELGQWASGGTPDRARSDFFQGNIPWFAAGELNAMYVSESSERITDLALRRSSAKLFVEGSILLGMYDTAALKASILEVPASSNQACANFEPGPAVIVEWFYYFIQLSKEHFLLRRRGVRQKNLNLGMIRAFDVPLPPVSLQEEFVSIVRQVRKIHAGGSAAGVLCRDLTASLRNQFLGAQS